ncbi:MAG: hypothetical protein JWR39_479 [Devosia sp.]|jgi:hypothetical protein|nr:hypothetical protein [Devosia sp.]
MSIERETNLERPVHHETVVTHSSSGRGTIFAILAAVVLVLLALWLFGAFSGGGSVDLPTVSGTP